VIVLGIDPGASGALAWFDVTYGKLFIKDMPTVHVKRGNKLKNELSPQMLTAMVAKELATIAVLERVGAMPGQGVSSMFQFGRGVGMIEGVVAANRLRIDYVAPQVWQKALGVRDGKDASRARAAELFPAYADLFARKKDSGRADAALIAYWYASRAA
jgi:crossover junction endodeoxyribonuclease RuvC